MSFSFWFSGAPCSDSSWLLVSFGELLQTCVKSGYKVLIGITHKTQFMPTGCNQKLLCWFVSTIPDSSGFLLV